MSDGSHGWSRAIPPHHIDLMLDASGGVGFMGPGAAEWLASDGCEAALLEALSANSASQEGASWWFKLWPLHVRCVRMDGRGSDGGSVLVTVVPPRPELAEAMEVLSPMQQVVADFAAAGATVDEIARAIDRSPETVRSHIKEAYNRLSICTRLELSWLLRRPAISYGS